MANDDALTAIEPATTEFQVGERSITIGPLRVRQLAAFGRTIRPLLPSLQRLLEAADGEDLSEAQLGELFAVLDELDLVIEAVRIGANVDPEWLGEQHLDVLVRLAAAVFNANISFFATHLAPAAVEVLHEVTAARRTGTTQSSDSSEPDSPETTSST